MIHQEPSPLAGQTVKIEVMGSAFDYVVEDWWDRINGKSWKISDGNPAALKYAMRIAGTELPLDDQVLYGKVNGMGELVHIGEIIKEGSNA